MTITPEELAAYADGELSGADEARVAEAIAADPELQSQVDAHKALKATLSAHFAPILEQELPDKLTVPLKAAETPREAEVINFAAEKQKRGWAERLPKWSYVAGPALAASLVAVVVWPSSDAPQAGYANTQLASVLDKQLVAEQGSSADTRILLSFRDGSGDYCRAFSSAERGGIACRDEQGWQLQAVAPGSEPALTDYRQAGSSEADILERVQDLANGPALDAEQEAAAKESGWQ